MDYKIIADSSCDLDQNLKEKMEIQIVPLTLQIEDKIYLDDEKLDVKAYIEDMHNSEEHPKTSCPSPDQFMTAYKCEQNDVYVVTLSSELSGTYNSAELAKNMYLEDNKKNIHVFNSKSACIGETLIAMKVFELANLNKTYNQVVQKTSEYIEEMKTFFVLENVQHLAKAGRMKAIAAKLINVLNIKLILGADDDGNIKLVDKARGYKKALKKLADTIEAEGKSIEEKVLGIAHCDCLEKAIAFKEEVLKRYNFKDIIIVEMAGLSTTYADKGGIVIAF